MNLVEQHPDLIPHWEAVQRRAELTTNLAKRNLGRLTLEISGQMQLDLYPEPEAA